MRFKNAQPDRAMTKHLEEGLAALGLLLPEEVLDVREAQSAARPGADARAGVHEARFTAGIVRFYEAVLNEPIPGKMLRMVEEIAKRERKS